MSEELVKCMDRIMELIPDDDYIVLDELMDKAKCPDKVFLRAVNTLEEEGKIMSGYVYDPKTRRFKVGVVKR